MLSFALVLVIVPPPLPRLSIVGLNPFRLTISPVITATPLPRVPSLSNTTVPPKTIVLPLLLPPRVSIPFSANLGSVARGMPIMSDVIEAVTPEFRAMQPATERSPEEIV